MDGWKDRQRIYVNFLHLVIICLHVSLCIKVHVERSEDKFGGVSPFFHHADSRDQTEDGGHLYLLRCLSSSLCLSNVDPPSFLLPPGSLHRSLPVRTSSLCSFCLHCFMPITLINFFSPSYRCSDISFSYFFTSPMLFHIRLNCVFFCVPITHSISSYGVLSLGCHMWCYNLFPVNFAFLEYIAYALDISVLSIYHSDKHPVTC